MAFTIEDGTGKSDANSFATVAELTTFAGDRGFTIGSTDALNQQALVKAADYIIGLENRMKGYRTNEGQRLPYPRYGVSMYDGVEYLDNDEIPEQLKEAQMRLAISSITTELVPDGTGREVAREKVGPLEVEYSERGSGSVNPQFNQAMQLLAPLLEYGGSGVIEVCRA